MTKSMMSTAVCHVCVCMCALSTRLAGFYCRPAPPPPHLQVSTTGESHFKTSNCKEANVLGPFASGPFGVARIWTCLLRPTPKLPSRIVTCMTPSRIQSVKCLTNPKIQALHMSNLCCSATIARHVVRHVLAVTDQKQPLTAGLLGRQDRPGAIFIGERRERRTLRRTLEAPEPLAAFHGRQDSDSG